MIKPDKALTEAQSVMKYTTLFANVGIGETYLEDIGFEGAVANEILENRAEWYKDAYPKCNMIVGDIMDDDVFNKVVKSHQDLGCKLLLTSPPCQSFSIVGGQNLASIKTYLFNAVLKFAKETKVPYIMVENVEKFWTSEVEDLGMSAGKYVKQELEKLGYIVHHANINAKYFETPQSRTRCILVATYKPTLNEYPEWKLPEVDESNVAVLKDYIDDQEQFPSIDYGCYQGYDKEGNPVKWHRTSYLSKKHREIMHHTPEGCSAHDNQDDAYKPRKSDGSIPTKPYTPAYARNAWDKPAACVLQGSDSFGGIRTFHPGYDRGDGTWSDARYFSLLEIFVITGLGKNPFVPLWASNNDKLIRNVIGECFAPKLVKAIVDMIPR